MSQILTNEQFVTEINKLITKWGGTSSDLSLTPDEANDVINDRVFNTKMQELINVAPTGGGGSGRVEIHLEGGTSGSSSSITIVNADKTPAEVKELIDNGETNIVAMLSIPDENTIFYLSLTMSTPYGAMFSSVTGEVTMQVVVAEQYPQGTDEGSWLIMMNE